MTTTHSTNEQKTGNEEEIKWLVELVETSGRSQMCPNVVYLQEGQNHYKAVKTLKTELGKE